ncbi:hypothetical protein ABZX98_17010 [Streptomyces sp. NPDC002992]|uniref:hypothetical protein n=1 Tax=Streptomyces sp. NPDC002992 TaxID=3154273 RepID=UPI0033B72E21
MRVTAREGVHPWQIGLAACAVGTPLTLVIASGDPFFVLPFMVATTMLTAVPLFLYARPSAVQWATGTIAAVLRPWSLIGSGVGMLVFSPSVPSCSSRRTRTRFGARGARGSWPGLVSCWQRR